MGWLAEARMTTHKVVFGSLGKLLFGSISKVRIWKGESASCFSRSVQQNSAATGATEFGLADWVDW